MRHIAIVFCLLLLGLAATFLVYSPGLSGPFVFDDIANITRNARIAITSLNADSVKAAAFSGASGPLGRPVSMASFAINHYMTGWDPYYFKLVNLAIHLLNGAGIFILTSLLLSFYRKRFEPGLSSASLRGVTLAVAFAWLLHPFNLTSVLYVVQRMTALAAFFSIWGLTVFFWGRARLYEGKSGVMLILSGLLLFAPLAAFSKENGLLLPLFMLVAEMTLFAFHVENSAARRFLIAFYAGAVAVPVVLALGYLAIHPDWLLGGYKNREFTLSERLMTEGRVIWFYIWQILLPSNAQMGLYHDDIAISRGLLQPASTVLSLIGVVALFWLSFAMRKKAPIAVFGVLFFLTGHLLESTGWPLDIAHEHRNYLPMYGIVLTMFFYLLHPSPFIAFLRLRQLASFALISIFAFGTFVRATAWANPYDFALSEFNHHPDSVRANIELGHVYDSFESVKPEAREEYYRLARQRYEYAARLDKNDIGGLTGLVMSSAKRGKAVEEAWLKELSFRLEHAPYAAITSDKLLGLTTCYLKGECNLPSGSVGDLLGAALRNPTLSGLNRAKTLYALSSYMINVKHDYPAVLEIMHQMIGAAPREPAYRLALINFLMALQHFDEAKKQLASLKNMGALQDYSIEIKLVEQKLSEQGY